MAIDLTKVSVATTMRGGALVAANMNSGAPAITFDGSFTASSFTESAPTSFASLSIGAADTNRIVAAVIHYSGAALRTITAMTIGGVTASLVFKQDSTAFCGIEIWQAAVPTGTTATVAITWSVNPSLGGCALYRIITGTTASTASAGTSGSGTVSATVPATGYAVVGYAYNDGSGPYVSVPSNYTQDANNQFATTRNGASMGHITASATIDNNATPAADSQALCYAAWGA